MLEQRGVLDRASWVSKRANPPRPRTPLAQGNSLTQDDPDGPKMGPPRWPTTDPKMALESPKIAPDGLRKAQGNPARPPYEVSA